MPFQHQRIFLELQQAIHRGQLAEGARLPSENALAHRHGVSRPTAGRAVESLRRLNLVVRKIGSGTYVRSRLPAKGSLGLIADGLGGTEIVAPLSAALAHAGHAAGWSLVFDDPIAGRDPERIAAEWKRRGVRGVFFAPLEHHPVREGINRTLADRLRRFGLAVVLLDRDILDYPAAGDCDLVGVDDFAAGYALGRHVLERDRTRVCFVARPDYPATTELRLAGIRAAAPGAPFAVGDPARASWLRTVLRQHAPDAILCSNDATAAAAIAALSTLRKRVPQDLAVAGFDDAGLAAALKPRLTSMRQPIEAIGLAALEAMLGRLRSPEMPPRRILLRAQLKARESTGR